MVSSGPGKDPERSGSEGRRWGRWAAFAFLWSFWTLMTVKFYWSLFQSRPDATTWAVADDVYITANFSRTLAEGGGVTWYPGSPRVEGFSSPVWVLVLAAVHLLPGFTEDRLGLYVLVLGWALLGTCAWLVTGAVDDLARRAGARGGLVLAAATSVAAMSGVSLSCWVASGFEVSLVAAASLAALRLGLQPPSRRRDRSVGAVAALALATRLDAAVCLAAPLTLALLDARGWRARLRLVAVPLFVMVGLFLLRRWYFGEWLPNTYYLKVTAWPLRDRWAHGIFQTAPIWICIVPALLPAVLLFGPFDSAVRLRATAASLSGYVLATIYSASLGGDIVFECYGYDRFTTVGALGLPVGLAALLMTPASRWGITPMRAGVVVAIGAIPFLFRPTYDGRVHLRRSPLLTLEAFDWSRPLSKPDLALVFRDQGLAIGRITHRGAKAAVCAAGAPVYFSRRGGVDLLGKVDPRVARLPASSTPPPNARCWRGYPGPGHNKEDTLGSFALERPDVSMVHPPEAFRTAYEKVGTKNATLWARIGSRRVNWAAAPALP